MDFGCKKFFDVCLAKYPKVIDCAQNEIVGNYYQSTT